MPISGRQSAFLHSGLSAVVPTGARGLDSRINALLTSLLLRLVLRFWRPISFALVVLVVTELLAHPSPTQNIVVLCSAFGASGIIFELQRRRRRKLGIWSVPEVIVAWYRRKMSAGVKGDALELRKASALMVGVALFAIALDSVFVGLLFAPTSFGESHPFYLEGRILCSLFASVMLALGLVILAMGVAAFRSARFARWWAGRENTRIGPFSSETNVLTLGAAFVLALVIAGAFLAAAPTPTHAQTVAEQQREAAQRLAEARANALAELTRNVHPLGATASDGEFDFSVRSIRAVGTVRQEGGPPAGATRGDRLVLVEIFVRNNSDRALPPFGAAGFGVLLVDARGRRYQIATATFGFHDPVPDVKSGSTSLQTLVFQLPIGDPLNGVLVWDLFEPGDPNGATYVYFRAGSAPAVARLGPTAYGASTDH